MLISGCTLAVLQLVSYSSFHGRLQCFLSLVKILLGKLQFLSKSASGEHISNDF